MPNKISVIIPAYNEEENISDIVKRIKNVNQDFEIIVVDDASLDKTAAEAQQAGAKVVSCTYNLGNGAAVKRGARSASADILVLMDADKQHQPEDIPKLLEFIGPYDMVVGSRAKDARVSRIRKIGNCIFIKIAEFLAERKIPDLTSGFRVVKKERFMEFIHLLPNGYSYPSTITLAMLKSGYFVKYVGLSSIGRRSSGKSSVNLFKDGIKFINIIFRTAMLFSPQRIFIPLGLLFTTSGLAVAVWKVITTKDITDLAVILFSVGTFIFMFGLLADQIAQIRRQMR